MADDDAGGIDALLLEDAELGQAHVGHDRVGRQGEAGLSGGARRGPVDSLLRG